MLWIWKIEENSAIFRWSSCDSIQKSLITNILLVFLYKKNQWMVLWVVKGYLRPGLLCLGQSRAGHMRTWTLAYGILGSKLQWSTQWLNHVNIWIQVKRTKFKMPQNITKYSRRFFIDWINFLIHFLWILKKGCFLNLLNSNCSIYEKRKFNV